jgi:hypothetical protein
MVSYQTGTQQNLFPDHLSSILHGAVVGRFLLLANFRQTYVKKI